MTSQLTLTGDLRRGDETQVLLKLQNSGVLPQDYAAIATNKALLAEIVAAIQRHCMFTSPEDQILRMLEVNEAVWKDTAITEEAVKEAGEPLDCPASDETGLYCVGLFSETGDVLKTFQRNWQAAAYVLSEDKTWKWDGLLFTPEGVQRRPNAQKRPTGLRWAVCELGRAHQDKCVKDARSELDKAGIMGMGQELPFVAALHPNWAVTMNGQDIPYVDAPDLQVAPAARGEFYCTPYLSFFRGNGEVRLDASHVEVPFSCWGSGSIR